MKWYILYWEKHWHYIRDIYTLMHILHLYVVKYMRQYINALLHYMLCFHAAYLHYDIYFQIVIYLEQVTHYEHFVSIQEWLLSLYLGNQNERQLPPHIMNATRQDIRRHLDAAQKRHIWDIYDMRHKEKNSFVWRKFTTFKRALSLHDTHTPHIYIIFITYVSCFSFIRYFNNKYTWRTALKLIRLSHHCHYATIEPVSKSIYIFSLPPLLYMNILRSHPCSFLFFFFSFDERETYDMLRRKSLCLQNIYTHFHYYI